MKTEILNGNDKFLQLRGIVIYMKNIFINVMFLGILSTYLESFVICLKLSYTMNPGDVTLVSTGEQTNIVILIVLLLLFPGLSIEYNEM